MALICGKVRSLLRPTPIFLSNPRFVLEPWACLEQMDYVGCERAGEVFLNAHAHFVADSR